VEPTQQCQSFPIANSLHPEDHTTCARSLPQVSNASVSAGCSDVPASAGWRVNRDAEEETWGKELWIPLSQETRQMLDDTERTSTHIIVNKQTGQPYTNRNDFGKTFGKVRKWAVIERPLTFHDPRTTALTNLGNKGSTMAEIVTFSGHKLNSPVLHTYVKPGREAAIRALNKLETNRD
jgi:integrase